MFIFFVSARNGSRTLASLTKADRADIISIIADLLIKKEPEILAANKLDLEKAQLEGITGPMFSRYKLLYLKMICSART
jgi:gamma-glutamyl phosphate reductase